MKEIYLDNSATTPVCDKAIDAVNNALTSSWHNPSSLYRRGMEAEMLINSARKNVAKLLSSDMDEIFFTSCGTESNNTAIFSAVEHLKKRGNRIVTTTIEHPSVKNPVKKLEENGFEVIWLKPNRDGKIEVEQIKNAINEKTILVSVMYINNETGAIQPIDCIKPIIKEAKSPALFHCDAVQAFGKIEINPKKLGIDLMSARGHKLHAPKGVGILYKSKDLHIPPFIFGGGQEKGFRSGTESVPLIAGFGAALQDLDIKSNYNYVKEVSDYGKEKLRGLDNISFNSPCDALPYIINISVLGYRSEILLHFLEADGILVSSGSACSKGGLSSVLQEMGISGNIADSAIRISLSRYNEKADFDKLFDALEKAQKKLKRK